MSMQMPVATNTGLVVAPVSPSVPLQLITERVSRDDIDTKEATSQVDSGRLPSTPILNWVFTKSKKLDEKMPLKIRQFNWLYY